jgi:hypothetical protein
MITTVDDYQAAMAAARADIRQSRCAAINQPFIGIYADGGIGDTLRLIAVAKAVKRQWPRSRVHLVARDLGPDADGLPMGVNLLRDNTDVDASTWIPRMPGTAMKIYRDFDIFFEAHYVIRTYNWIDPIWQHKADLCLRPFERWEANFPASSRGIQCLRMTQWEIQAASSGLDISENDLSIAQGELPAGLPPSFVAIHNMAGGTALSKCAPMGMMAELSGHLVAAGVPVVQVGAATDPAIRNADDFRGLNINSTAAVLAQAAMLIDIEGGLGYVARAVGTRRACFFASTPHEVFRFERDIILTTGRCPACWHDTPRWMVNCKAQYPVCLNVPDDAAAVARHILPAIRAEVETRQPAKKE